MEAKIYCPSMWKSVHVDTDGYLTPCCLFIHHADKKTKITDIKESISEVLINEFEEYREQLRNGVWPTGCNQCKFAEEEGRSSKRQQDMWSITSGSMRTDPEKVNLEYLQLKTGRLCNLRCTICTPSCSTSIAVDLLKNNKITREYYNKLENEIAWSYDIEEFKKMNPPETGYYRIDIAGGEPLMNKTHFKWLNQISDPEHTQLLYNTNGTHLPTRNEIDIWKKFKGIWLTFSIDSYGKRFEELRVGAIWDEVLQNLKYCQEEIIAKEFKNYSNCAVVMTISRFNVKDVFELYDIITQKVTFNHPDPLNFNYLFYPEHLSCHNMSNVELKEVIELYEEKIPLLPTNSKMYKQCVDLKNSLITFLDNKK
jgi:radical SAM protein with 4Fe4S-binding SPASM domain